jgi:hypothetical protein
VQRTHGELAGGPHSADSQFPGMLELIAIALNEAGVPREVAAMQEQK